MGDGGEAVWGIQVIARVGLYSDYLKLPAKGSKLY